jgi:hypothetical protein
MKRNPASHFATKPGYPNVIPTGINLDSELRVTSTAGRIR